MGLQKSGRDREVCLIILLIFLVITMMFDDDGDVCEDCNHGGDGDGDRQSTDGDEQVIFAIHLPHP